MNHKPATEIIEARIDKGAAGKLSVTNGGMNFRDMGEVMEFAKLMAISGQAVPSHLRNQVGTCLAIIIQSLEWRMSPFAVASKSYTVNDRVCYESQLIHAVIEQRAPLEGRLRHSFAGQGDKRTCTVKARLKGEEMPFEYTSPPIGTITPKNSPLWKTKPDLQLYYNTTRDWARMYFPDVIMGVYSDDEMTIVTEARATRESRMENLTSLLAAPEQEGELEESPEPEPQQSETPEAALSRWRQLLKECKTKAAVDGVMKQAFLECEEASWSKDEKANAMGAIRVDADVYIEGLN